MFGGPSQTPFGSPAGGGGFGQPSAPGGFGSPAPAPFGQAPAGGGGGFGAFGAPSPAPVGFGGFGGQTTPAASGFGAAPSTGFGGAPASSGGFGGQPNNNTGFGGQPAAASSPFGAAPAPATGGLFGSAPVQGGAFGAPAPSQGGAFGAPSAPGGFGAPSTNTGFGAAPSTAFGASSTQTTAFGAPPQAPGMFGSAPAPATGGLFGSAPAPATGGAFGGNTGGGFGSATTNNAFGGQPQATGGMFGTPAQAPPGGNNAFGSPAASTGGGGTRIAPFQAQSRQDGSNNITLYSISAMQQYANKSFEELRFEDYSQGNKGSATPGPTGGFGAQQPGTTGGLFGGQPAAAPAGGLFGGQPAAAPLGGFGAAPAPVGGGLFGAAPAPQGAFGSPAAQNTFGGQPAQVGFGAAPAPVGGGLFGAAPAPQGAFGAAPATGLFGAAPAPVGGGLFGAAPAPQGAFGSPAPIAGGGLFGAAPAAPAGGLFGAPAPAAFGAPAGGGLFGAPPAPAGGGLFGAPAPTPTAFGAPAAGGLFGNPAPAPAAGGLFGAPTAAPAYGYGAQPQASSVMQMHAAPPLGSVIAPAVNEIMTSQLAALDAKRKELEQKDNFRNRPSHSSAITAISQRESRNILPVSSTKISTYRASPSSNVKIRPRGFASPPSDAKYNNMPQSLSKLGTGGKPMAAPETVAAASRTNLIIAPSPKPKLKLAFGGGEKRNVNNASSSSTPFKQINGVNNNINNNNVGLGSVQKSVMNTPEPVNTPRNAGTTPRRMDPAEEYYQNVIRSPDEAAGVQHASRGTTGGNNGAPTLSKDGYSCSPSIAELQRMDPADLAAIANFSVTREGVGKVEWEGAVDVRGADLDSIVVIEQSEVSIYTNEENMSLKPPRGTKLNRPAKLTMENVFPKNRDAPNASEKFKRKVATATMNMGAELINYDPQSGVWLLLVDHFSRYGLDDDDSDDDDEEMQQEQQQIERKVDFSIGDRGGRSPLSIKDDGSKRGGMKRQDTPYKPKGNYVLGEDDVIEVSDNAMVTTRDVVMTEASIMEDAETAFNQMQMTLEKDNEVVAIKKKIEKDTALFPEEGPEDNNETSQNTCYRYIPNSLDFRSAASMPSFSSKLLKSTSKKTSNNIDFGLRMGRSFRVGWSPDGSFLSLGKNGVLIRSKPKFEDSISIESELRVLETHRSHHNRVKKEGNCPLFSLSSNGANGNTSPIENTLESYSEAVKNTGGGGGGEIISSISKSAFSLLKVLHTTQTVRQNHSNNQDAIFGGGGANKPAADHAIDNQCMVSITRWFIDSCSPEVDNEIRQAKSNQERYKGLLSAVSGGDLSTAAKIAEEDNLTELSILLASGPEARGDIFQEIMAWRKSQNSTRIPENMLRTYRLIAGDLGMEENVFKHSRDGSDTFDWRRRMVMKLMYSSQACKTLKSAISLYDADVSKGISPFPSAHHNDNNTVESLLFRLLKLGSEVNSSPELSLSNIVDPLGYTQDSKNFSLSFHLTSCITAMYRSPSLTPEEEYTILDGYAFQLQSLGLWEWAVYVFLCVLSGGESSLSSSWRIQHAKSLVLQNFNNDDESNKKRLFLEKGLEVPSDWFEEAMCYRSNATGDVLGYITHQFKLDEVKGTKVIERTLVPNILFNNREKQEAVLQLLDDLYLSEENESLVWAISTFFEIYDQIHFLEGCKREEIEKTVPMLLEACEKIGHIFSSCKASEEKLSDNTLDIIPATYAVPMGSFLAEALHQTSHFKLQVLTLKEGMTISSTASQKLKLLRAQGFSEGENICRWLM